MNHHEHQDSTRSKKALILAIGATSAIFVLELFGWFWTNSLALLSDAAHGFMDLLSFALCLAAILIAERPISDLRTFGWHRLEVFAALMNGLTVILMAIFLSYHALQRMAQPQEILSREMFLIALVGLFVNLFVLWKLHPHAGKDLNVRGAFLHAFGDAVASVAVVSGGILVLLTGHYIIDAIAAMLVALIIVVHAGALLKDSFHILLEGTPKGLERTEILRTIEKIAGKTSVKDLHIWNLCSHINALTAHVILPEEKMIEQKMILEKIHSELQEKFNIVHSTVQIESELWDKKTERRVWHGKEKEIVQK